MSIDAKYKKCVDCNRKLSESDEAFLCEFRTLAWGQNFVQYVTSDLVLLRWIFLLICVLDVAVCASLVSAQPAEPKRSKYSVPSVRNGGFMCCFEEAPPRVANAQTAAHDQFTALFYELHRLRVPPFDRIVGKDEVKALPPGAIPSTIFEVPEPYSEFLRKLRSPDVGSAVAAVVEAMSETKTPLFDIVAVKVV